jgi:hypothetical protein
VKHGPGPLLAKLIQQEDEETVTSGSVVCRLSERDVLIQDTWQAIEASIPRDQLKKLLAALKTISSTQIRFKGLQWTFETGQHGLEVTVEDETERFEEFTIQSGPWNMALEQISLLQTRREPDNTAPAHEQFLFAHSERSRRHFHTLAIAVRV